MNRWFICAGLTACLGGIAAVQASTVAHWNFSGPTPTNGAYMAGNGTRADLDGDGAMDSDDFRISALDLSGNGNHLTAWTSEWMKWSSDSVMGDFSMQAGNYLSAASTDSAYNPHITGTDLESITPARWTVEALFKAESLGPVSTLVGRDGRDVGGAASDAAAFYLSIRNTDLAVEYRDVEGKKHNLQVPAKIKPDVWYRVAAVSDGSELELYLNGRQIGMLDLTNSTHTALGLGFGTWSVSRGMWAGNHVDRFSGLIDEVAVSDEALNPGSFVIQYPNIGQDRDGDGMGDQYEAFFGLDAGNGSDAVENADTDSLINFFESTLNTDPHVADTDTDGLNDDIDDKPLSRAVMMWGHPDFTTGDTYDYTGPTWWVGAGKIGGVWTNGNCWMVSPGGHGMLYIDIDRNLVSSNLVLNLLHQNEAECQVYLDLGEANGTVLVSNLYGDLAEGDGSQDLGRYMLPLEAYPEASRIIIDATAGTNEPYMVWAATLYEDADADGLDSDQEKQFGTSDARVDSDGDDLIDYAEVLVYGTNPSDADSDRDGYPDGEESLVIGSSPMVPMWQEGGMPGVLQVERWYNIEGATMSSLFAYWRFGAMADDCVLVNATEYAPENMHHGDNYGIRMRGTITAPVTGEYTFQLTGDDVAQVWFSDRESPYDRKLLLELEGWTPYQDLADEDSSVATVDLTAGNAYYFEILLKECRGDEHVSLWWTRPGCSEPEIIGSDYLYSYVQPADDQDGDGLPEEWEAATGLFPNLGDGGGLRDTDGDAYSDFEEYAYGLNPRVADEDADGLSGGDEASITLTDPHSPDSDGDGTPDLTAALSIRGADYMDCRETHFSAVWSTDGTNAILKEANAGPWVTYSLNVDNAGMYRLAVDATNFYTFTAGILAREIRLRVEIDGSVIEEVWMNHSSDLPAYTCFTPWLTEGVHTLKLSVLTSWWSTGPFQIHGIELGAIDGFDSDGDGIQDWEEAIFEKGIDTDGDGISDADEVLLYHTNPLDTDTDGDSLSDSAELDAGTDLLNPDTDGDGISDGEEVLHAFTDPLVMDFGSASTLLELGGSNFVSSICAWDVEGSSAYALDRNGALEYTLPVPGNGNYVLEIEVAEHNELVFESRFDLSVAFDGIMVDRAPVDVARGGIGLLKVWLPMAEAGDHTVQLKWNNIVVGSSLQVNALRLLSYGGPDADGNGQADWLDTRFENLVGDMVYVQSSPVSPVCLEGTSPNCALVSVSADFIPSDKEAQSPAVKKGIADGWYANVMLNPYADTLLGVSPSSGSETEVISVDWFETNVMTIPSNTTLTVRLNDALLLSAIPEGAKQGSMILSIEGPSFTTNMVTLTDMPAPYVFEEAGTYIINGFYSKSRAVYVPQDAPVNLYGYKNGVAVAGVFNHGNTQTNTYSLTIDVVDAGFASDPQAVKGVQRNWSCPAMPTNLYIEADSGVMLIASPATDDGTDFSLLLSSDQDRTVLARLCESGPIVDRATVHPLAYNLGGYWRLVSTFPDGSVLAMFTIVLSDVPEDLEIQMYVTTSGTTFIDGSLSMNLTADDFGEDGVATYYMVRDGSLEALCHDLSILQAGESIN